MIFDKKVAFSMRYISTADCQSNASKSLARQLKMAARYDEIALILRGFYDFIGVLNRVYRPCPSVVDACLGLDLCRVPGQFSAAERNRL